MDKDLPRLVERMFSGLNNQSAAGAIPEPATLSGLLSSHVVPTDPIQNLHPQPKILMLFATAAVEMWQRSIHSFLISASLTKASPIWSSVAGYYSSHYSIRAFAHLFGFFNLHREKRIVRLTEEAGRLMLRFDKKNVRDGEHKFYWKVVSEHRQLAADPFFYAFRDDTPDSDGAHRAKANYHDHINHFPVFLPLDQQFLKERVERIATLVFSDVPVPNADDFPDTDNVQFVAYHRLVKFRRLVDEILGTQNRFWRVHRDPPWRPGGMKFSIVEPVFAALYANR
jgi:hypothetical protein